MQISDEIQRSPHEEQNLNNQNSENMFSLFIVNSTIRQLMNYAFNDIKSKQLLNFIPQFQHHHIMTLLSSFIDHSTPNYGTCQPSKLYEQNSSDIIKIQKDNLSPKQLPSQHPQKDQNVKQLDFLSSGGSRKLNMTNRSSFLKRKSSQISQLPSGMNTQRTKLQSKISYKSNDKSSQKLLKGSLNKKDPLQNFTSLLPNQNQDPQINHLRQIVHFNLKQKEKQQKIHNERLNEDRQKLQNFNSLYGDHGKFTFDFDGQTIGSDALKDQKINYYAMRVGVKTLGKKFRTIYKHLQNPKEQQNKNQQTTAKTKYAQRKSSLQTSNILNASFQIPMFQRQNNTFMPQIDPSKLKIIEYKRLYGKKFSRYDKNSMTIDLSSVVDNKIPEQDLFSSKRHLTDSLSINKSRSSSVNKQYLPRKLALPKLQGKYKVLDRYDQF